METLNLSKKIKIAIDGDASRVVSFNPQDAFFRNRFMRLYQDVKAKQAEFSAKAKEIDAIEGEDENKVPNRAMPALDFEVETARYLMGQIDEVFGTGTSTKVFEDGFDFDAFQTFFAFVIEKIGVVSSQKIQAHLAKKPAKKTMQG